MNIIPFEQIIENLPEGVTIHDRAFTIIYQNKAMQKIFGNHRGEKCFHIYEKRDEPCEGCGLIKAFESGQSNMVLRTAYQEDGSTSYWENSCMPLMDENGQIKAGVEVCRQITDRVSLEAEVKERNIELGQLNKELTRKTVQLEEALSEQKKTEQERAIMEAMLAHANKMESVGQLAAGIAHEINTPMQFIGDNICFIGRTFADVGKLLEQYTQLQRSCRAGEETIGQLSNIDKAIDDLDLEYSLQEIPKAIEETLDGVKRVTGIIRSLKEFSHPQSNEKTAADLNRAIQTTVNICRNEWKYQAELRLDLDSELPLVSCYIDDINQVLLNIIINAVHAVSTVEHGKITIKTSKIARGVEIRISDNGPGIAPEIRDRIFDPFFTTKELSKGTGLGLAISHAIITKKHNGSIAFESEVGRGTCFIISLPE